MPISYTVEEFFLDSVVSVSDDCAHVYSIEFALFGTCIFSIGQIEISSKSSSGRTGRLRSTKLLCASATQPYMRDLEPRPPPVSPLEGAKKFFSIAIFSVTAADSATVLSALGAALGSLTSAPEIRGPQHQIGGEGPPTEISLFSTEIFLRSVRSIKLIPL